MNLRLNSLGLAALATATPLLAEVAVSENFFVSAYAVGAWTNTENDGGEDVDTFLDSGSNTLDSAKVTLKGVAGPLTAVGSLFYIPELVGPDDEVGILDAYLTYTSGPFSVTGGKFLSWHGYEAFDAVNMTQLTYALISGIPAYHTGVKVEISEETFSAGVAALDSVNPGDGFFQGDGEIDDDIGVEAYFTWKGTENLTLYTGIAFEDTDGAADDFFLFDIWASYVVSEQVTLAAEYAINENVAKSWLALIQYTFTPNFFVIGRLSGIDFDDGGDAFKYTVAPTFVINENISLRAEFSKTEDAGGDPTFYGVQAVLKF